MAPKKNRQDAPQAELPEETTFEFPDDGAGDPPEEDDPVEAAAEESEEQSDFAEEESAPEPPPRAARVSRARRPRTARGRKTQAPTQAPQQGMPNIQIKFPQPKAEKPKAAEEGPPRLTDVLDSNMGDVVSISRVATKGSLSKDCGFVGVFPNTLETRRTLQQNPGGGTYRDDFTGKTFELAGQSKPIVEEEPGDTPLFGGMSHFLDDEEELKREQRWWVYRPKEERWVWMKPNSPITCPPPSNGEPPPSFSYLNGPSSTQTAQSDAIPSKVEKEFSELKTLFLQQQEDRRSREASEARRQERDDAERKERALETQRRIERDDQIRREEISRKELEEQRRQDRAEAARKDEWAKREAERREELERRREETAALLRDRKDEFEKREADRKAEAERRDHERREEKEKDEQRRLDQRASEERLFNLLFQQSKKGGLSDLKELGSVISVVRDITGLGGERNDSLEMVKVGTELVANSVLPALADLVSAWKHPRVIEQQVEGQQEPEPQHISAQQPQALPGPQASQDPRPPVKELSTAQLLDVVDFVTNSYKAGNSPRVVSVGLPCFLVGRGIPAALVKAKLAEMSADQLEGLLVNALTMIPPGIPVHKVVSDARGIMATADAKVWFTTLTDIIANRTQAPPKEPENPSS